MRIFFINFILICAIEQTVSAKVAIAQPTALERLMEGNKRFVDGNPQHPRQNLARRTLLLRGQRPIAAVVGCSDSRVPPELIFDAGLGDLFVVRVAGNVIGEFELESLIFGVKTLEAPIILVLGHENCAAVNAALTNSAMEFNIEEIGQYIRPLVPKAESMPGNALENLIKLNVLHSVDRLKSLPQLQPYIQRNKLQILGGYYHLESGEVTLLKDNL